MGTAPTVDVRINDLHARSQQAFATAKIFERRARKYSRLITWLTFWGLVIPVTLGGIVVGNLVKPGLLEKMVWYAGALLVPQLVLSVWSLVAKWTDKLEYSSAAASDNFWLSDQFKAFASKSAIFMPTDFDVHMMELTTMDDAQMSGDTRQNISDFEKRYGHRAALIEFELTCKICKKPALSMKMAIFGRCDRCGGKRNGSN